MPLWWHGPDLFKSICPSKPNHLFKAILACCHTPNGILGNYRIVENFRGVQFLRIGNLQRFHGLIFTHGHSRAAPPTLPVASASYYIQSKTCQMTLESHMMEAIVCGYNIFKEISCAAEVIDHLLRDQLITRAITMAMARSCQSCILGSQELACRLLFCGFNFRGLPSNHKNCENWTSRKFPTIW